MLKNIKNTVINGNAVDVAMQMEDDSVDLIVTSPPYYNAKEYSQYESVNLYMDEMQDIFQALHTKLKKNRMCVINISPVLVPRKDRSSQSYRIPLPFYFVPMMEKIGYDFMEDIIWAKPEGAVPNRNGGFYRHRKPLAYKPNVVTEYILVFKRHSDVLIDKSLKSDSLVIGDYDRSNLWKFNPQTNSPHPAAFPIELPSRIIRYYSYEGDVVLDPFCGSGTTPIAAMRMSRNFIGIDINSHYCEMARERIQEELENKEKLC